MALFDIGLAERVAQVHEAVAGRDAEVDRLRRLPDDIIDVLRRTRLFSMLVEHRFGGLELDIPTGLRVVEEIAVESASVAWVLTIAATGAYWSTALVSDEICQVIHPADQPSVITGTAGPSGQATRDGGGWRISGRWAFASGSAHSDWVAVGCRLSDGHGPIVDDAGAPRFTSFLIPTSRMHIEDTWHVTGLRGTASNHYFVTDEDDIVVDDAMSFNHLADPQRRPGRRWAYPGLGHAFLPAVSVGIARGAVRDALGLLGTKPDRYGGVGASANQFVQFDLGKAAAKAEAAACVLHAAIDDAWARGEAGYPGNDVRARVRGACTFAVEAATEAVALARSAVGSSGIYESCPVEQRFRDASTAATQLGHRPSTYGDVGALLLGTYASALAIF